MLDLPDDTKVSAADPLDGIEADQELANALHLRNP